MPNTNPSPIHASFRAPWGFLAALLAAPSARAAAFAAPVAAPVPSGGGGMVRVALALCLVLGAVYAAAWLMRRLRGVGGASAGALQVVAQVALGARERAVVLRAGEQQLLLGVANGSVTFLCELRDEPRTRGPDASGGRPGDNSTPAGAATSATRPNFREMLLRSLGK